MSNARNNRYAAIPEVRDDLQSVATAVRALKQTVEVLSRQAGNENDWAATVADLTTAVNTATTQAKNNTDWSKLLNDPTIDMIFDRAASQADKLAQDVRDEARIALAKLQTALDNFKNGYADDNAAIKASISQLEVSVAEADAKIVSEQLVRATATQSLAGRIDTVNSQFQGNLAAVTTDITTLTNADSALATRIDTVTTASTNAKTYIQSTAPQSLATNNYWVDLSGATPVVKQWTGSSWSTQTATIGATAPTSPATNALWFDTSVSLLKKWSGSAWVNTGAFVQSKTPSTIAVGDYWLDTATANTLKRWDGTAWVAVDKNDNVFGILLSSVISESTSRTDSDRTSAVRVDNLISVAPDGNSATINNTQITTATRTSALASDLTNLQVQTTGGSAGGFYRLLASSSPGDGALAEFNVQVRAAETGANSTFSTAGMRIQAMSNGTSRVKFNADQFIVSNSTNTYVPFAITGGQLAVNALLSAANISGQVATSQISGLGTLATQNTVSNTQVTGLGAFATQSKLSSANIATFIDNAAINNALIANAAIYEANIANAQISNAKIQDAAISTAKIQDAAITTAKIQDATISTAKIGTAQIDTLRLAGSAVMVPVSYIFVDSSTTSLTVPFSVSGLNGGETVPLHIHVGVVVSTYNAGFQVYVDGGLRAADVAYADIRSYVGVDGFVGNGSHTVYFEFTSPVYSALRRVSVLVQVAKR